MELRTHIPRSMSKVLITGHQGFIGRRLTKRLKDISCPPGAYESAKMGDEILFIAREEGNLTQATLPDADIVFHLAAYASVEESWKRPVDYMDNLRTIVRLVHAYPNAKIILASSCVNKNPESSPYAFSKRVAADYLKMFHKNWVNLLFPNIFGDSPRSVVDIYRKNTELTIFGDGEQIRDYVHVDDLVGALVLSQEWECGEYSLGSGVGVSVKQLAEATGKPITYGPARLEQREAVIPNTSPNWKPKINVLEYVKT